MVSAVIAVVASAYAQQYAPINPTYQSNVVAAIYKAEGGANTRYPYGIKSVDCGGDVSKARKICFNTVRNNYIRWQAAGKTNDFIQFLGARYCPIGAKDDPRNLNSNWVRNVKKILAQGT